MNRLSRQQDLAIVSAWLLSDTRNKIARDLDISGSTVSDVISCLPPIYLELRELNKNFRKLKVPVPTLSLTFKEILQNKGEDFKLEELPKLVAHAIKAAKDSNNKVDTVIAADHRLSKLEEKAGKPYFEAMKEYETKVDASKKLDEENAKKQERNKKLEQKGLEIKKQNTEARRKKKRTLKNARLTEKAVISFKEAEKTLSKFGLKIEDAKTLATHINFVKRNNCKPKEFALMVAENQSINEAIATAKNNLQEIQVKTHTAKKDEAQTRQAANRQHKRYKQNKNAAEFWQTRANYFMQSARSWEGYFDKTSWAAQQQKLYHNAIIEENIKNQKMNPETAAEYRRLKEMDLISGTLEEYTKALDSITKQKTKEFLSQSSNQEDSEVIHLSVEWVDKTNMKEG